MLFFSLKEDTLSLEFQKYVQRQSWIFVILSTPIPTPAELTTEPRALCLLGNHSTTELNSQSLILNFKVKLSYKETYLMYYLFSISSM